MSDRQLPCGVTTTAADLGTSSENQPDGSLSSVAFGPSGAMRIDYLDENGFGTFTWR